MDSYWNKNTDDNKDNTLTEDQLEDTAAADLRRGTKRSVKDRLGGKRVHMDVFKNEVLPAPGKPRQIPDIAEESLLEGTDEEFAEELADRLNEEKEDMIISLVKIVGRKVALDFYKETQKIESKGGMVINNGARRRTA